MEQAQNEYSLVVFAVGSELYALPTTAAREVIDYIHPRELPGSDAWVDGVINVRGDIIPVCVLSLALGLGAPERRQHIVITDVGDKGSAGFVVDDVHAVITITGEDVVPVPGIEHPAVQGLIHYGDRLVILLNAPSIVDGSAQSIGGMINSVREAADSILDPTEDQDDPIEEQAA